MKIAIIQPRTVYYVAGSEKVSLKHAEYLSALGHTVDFYTSAPRGYEETFLFKEFARKGIKNVNILRFDITDSVPGLYEQKPDADHVRWMTESFAFNERIYEEIKTNKPDIILSYYLPDSLFKPTGIPNIVYLSGYPSKPVPVYNAFIKFCDATISISSIVSEKWSEYTKDVPLKYSLGTGVDYPLVVKEKIKSKAKYNLVFAGRLVQRKGVVTLLDAFKEILKTEKDIHLWILGDGELNDVIREKVIESGIENFVSITGLVQNPYDYFAMADICIFPSHQGDGLMGTVLESMAAGKAVITTSNNGNEDVITDGVNGLLIEPKSPEAITEAVAQLIKHDELRSNMGQKAQEFIAKNVAWEVNVQKLSEILEEIVEKAR